MVSSRPAAAFCVEGELRRGGEESKDSLWCGSKTRSTAEYGLHLGKKSAERFVVFAFASGDNSYCEPYGLLI